MTGWRNLFREIVGTLIQSKEDAKAETVLISAFTGLLRGCTGDSIHQFCLEKINTLIKVWAEDLQAAGVDLNQYGEMLAKWQRGKPSIMGEGVYFRRSYITENFYRWKVYGFEFGPAPGDWGVWCSNPRDAFVGEFWEMVEWDEKHFALPGMWVD